MFSYPYYCPNLIRNEFDSFLYVHNDMKLKWKFKKKKKKISLWIFIFSAIPLLGYLPQDMNGMSIFDFYHKDDTETLYNIYRESKEDPN